MKFAANPIDTTHLTLGMLLHYLGKLKTNFPQMWKKMQRNGMACLIASIFAIHPQILIFSVFKIVSLSLY